MEMEGETGNGSPIRVVRALGAKGNRIESPKREKERSGKGLMLVLNEMRMSSKSQALSCCRLLVGQLLRDAAKCARKVAPFSSGGLYSTSAAPDRDRDRDPDSDSIPSNVVQELLGEVEKDRLRERQQRIRAGLDTADIDAEPRQDYMRVRPILSKLRRRKIKDSKDLDDFEEPTDSDSDDDDERFSPDAIQQRFQDFEKKFKKHEELLKNFTHSGIHPILSLLLSL